jgi:hypothetical protein
MTITITITITVFLSIKTILTLNNNIGSLGNPCFNMSSFCVLCLFSSFGTWYGFFEPPSLSLRRLTVSASKIYYYKKGGVD